MICTSLSGSAFPSLIGEIPTREVFCRRVPRIDDRPSPAWAGAMLGWRELNSGLVLGVTSWRCASQQLEPKHISNITCRPLFFVATVVVRSLASLARPSTAASGAWLPSLIEPFACLGPGGELIAAWRGVRHPAKPH